MLLLVAWCCNRSNHTLWRRQVGAPQLKHQQLYNKSPISSDQHRLPPMTTDHAPISTDQHRSAPLTHQSPPITTDHHRSPPITTDHAPISTDHHRSPSITTDHHRTPPITTDHAPITIDHHRSPPITTDHHRSPSITTDHHRPRPASISLIVHRSLCHVLAKKKEEKNSPFFVHHYTPTG